MTLPLAAIVGRPNVGKSTLFNRLAGRRRAIVTAEPGSTRDRHYAEVLDGKPPFRIVDTGGIGVGVAPFAREIEAQAETALREADVVLFLVDGREGPTAVDLDLATRLRRRVGPLLLVVNKVDTEGTAYAIHEFQGLGLGPPLPISAEQGRGLDELVEAICERLPPRPAAPDARPQPQPLGVAIVGRPNVGKSSLLNRLVGEDRALVSDVPGTTRDSVDTLFEYEGRSFRLIDTAGLRRAGRVPRGVEKLAAGRARDNIERADVVILVIDATDDLGNQDAHVAGYVHAAFKPVVVAVNKWDLVEEREEAAKRWTTAIRERLRFLPGVPVVFVSARTGQRASNLLRVAAEAWSATGIRVATADLNRWLGSHRAGRSDAPPPPTAFRLFYATQIGVHPPRFVLFCNDPGRAHFSVRRQLENSLREAFGFGSSPLRLEFRARRGDRG